MPGRLHALLILARSLVLTLLRRWLGRGPRGIALFRANFDADRLPPVDAAQRGELSSFGGCIACGRCDLGDAPRIAASAGAYPGTMRWVLASTRSMPDYDASTRALAFIDDAALASKERLCPTGVPLRRLVGFVRAQAAR